MAAPLKIFFFVFIVFNCFSVSSQNLFIDGTVTDEAGKPIPGCSVYFSNTSKGTLTSSAGEFTLKNLPEGKYELIVSAIGYQTHVLPVASANYPQKLHVLLKPRSSELEAVIVEPADKNGWRRWGVYFTENFIGTTQNANQCKLMNPEVLRFRYNKTKKRLTTKASEPLIIENKALGYSIKFQLEEFNADFNEDIVSFLGFPFFIEMESKEDKKIKRWRENRKKAYYGSLLHFMRAVYLDRFVQEGYAVTKKVANKNVSLYSLDTMMTSNSDGSKHLFFDDRVLVVYNQVAGRLTEASEIYFDSPEGIDIQANGSYYSPKVLVTNSHWGRYEKLSNMLPYDYTP